MKNKIMRLPDDPQSLGAPCPRLRVLLLGECHVQTLIAKGVELGHEIKHMLFNFRSIDSKSVDAKNFDCIVWTLNFRNLIAMALKSNSPHSDMIFARITDNSEGERIFLECIRILRDAVERLASEIPNVPIFCMSPLEPSFSYIGSLVEADDYTSHIYFIRQLNINFRSMLKRTRNMHYFETNDIANYIGLAHLRDDAIGVGTHGVFNSDSAVERDKNRIQISKKSSEIYNLFVAYGLFQTELWSRIESSMKTLRGTDRVKLIIVDLDDTMWRGTAAEMDLSDEIHWDIFEAYPIAFVEALLYFKKRGGILAVCSKNDREATLIRWAKIYRGAITPEDFACVKINWNSKAENIAEILRETNLLPESVVFIDDNPREVDAVRQRFPTLRCLSQDHIDWRRIILRAPEMLVDSITEESRRRTEMTQALVARTESKSAMSDAEWLLSLNIKQEIHFIRSPSDSRYRRVLELINKTNQFNTTGKRWEPAEFEQFVLENTCIATSLSDRTTNNGIIGVALVRGAEIVQVVLSCRVFGMGAEQVLGAIAVREALTNSPAATGRIVDTGKNFTCHKYFTDLQFAKSSDEIFEGRIVPPFPNWIEVREDLSETN